MTDQKEKTGAELLGDDQWVKLSTELAYAGKKIADLEVANLLAQDRRLDEFARAIAPTLYLEVPLSKRDRFYWNRVAEASYAFARAMLAERSERNRGCVDCGAEYGHSVTCKAEATDE